MIVEVLFALTTTATASASAEAHAVAPGSLEGRPPASQTSPLQVRIDAAAQGGVVEVAAGAYRGDLILDRPVRLVGRGRPLLVGSGAGSVVRIRAADVTIEGFDIDGGGGGDLGHDPSGIHVAAPRATIRDCRIRRSLFGIYVREAPGAAIEGCAIEGIRGKAPGEKGSGIHVWNTTGFRCERNTIADARDGFYIQSSSGGVLRGNTARDLRYGLHFMFSDDNVFEDNTFENGAAGAAIMYSRRIRFTRNRFVRNRGFASVGLLFKSCEDVTARANLLADNARGIFLEGTSRALFEGNVIAGSDAAIVLYDSCSGVRFNGNAFAGNMTPLTLVGKRTDTDFDGNYWSDNDAPDLDGDGRTDQAYRLTSLFDHFRSNLSAADLLSQGAGASALAMAERAFPVLSPIAAEDHEPLRRPPDLSGVPSGPATGRAIHMAGMGGALFVLTLGGLVFLRSRR